MGDGKGCKSKQATFQRPDTWGLVVNKSSVRFMVKMALKPALHLSIHFVLFQQSLAYYNSSLVRRHFQDGRISPFVHLPATSVAAATMTSLGEEERTETATFQQRFERARSVLRAARCSCLGQLRAALSRSRFAAAVDSRRMGFGTVNNIGRRRGWHAGGGESRSLYFRWVE